MVVRNAMLEDDRWPMAPSLTTSTPPLQKASTPFLLSGIIPAMKLRASCPATLGCPATRRCTGCVSSALQAGCTAGAFRQTGASTKTSVLKVDVPCALESCLASATPCKHFTLHLQPNGITPKMWTLQMTTLQLQASLRGGCPQSEAAGSRLSMTVLASAGRQERGPSANRQHMSTEHGSR